MLKGPQLYLQSYSIFFYLFINRGQDLDVGVVAVEVDLVLHLNNEQPFKIIVNNKINFTAIKA